MDKQDIGWAVNQMRLGHYVMRRGWNGKGMFLTMVHSDQWDSTVFNAPSQDFIAMKTAGNTLVPWLCSQSDLLADDWELFTP